jgi:hypothetical protein
MTHYSHRPSYQLYTRSPLQQTEWQDLLNDQAEPYRWGFVAAELDLGAGLDPMTADELAELWHLDYTEGYLDCIDEYPGRPEHWAPPA